MIDSAFPRRAQWLVAIIACIAVVASCRHAPAYQPENSGQPALLKHGDYQFHAAIWPDGHPYHPLCPSGRLCPDSVGVFGGVVTLADSYEQSSIDLDSSSDSPGCMNNGVRRVAPIDLPAAAGPGPMSARAAIGITRLKGGGDDMVTFRCPGLGREKDLVVDVYLGVHDPVRNSHWYMWRERLDCAPPRGPFSAATCPLILYGPLTVSPPKRTAD